MCRTMSNIPDQGHWVLGQPGWERVAEDTVAWLDGKAALECMAIVDFPELKACWCATAG